MSGPNNLPSQRKPKQRAGFALPGNANLPIGDGGKAQDANREIGVPRFLSPIRLVLALISGVALAMAFPIFNFRLIALLRQ